MKKLNRSLEFPGLGDSIYLDHAGSCLYSTSQLSNIFNEYKNHLVTNPHSDSSLSSSSFHEIRCRILKFFNTNNEKYSVIFTGGATHGIQILSSHFVNDSEDSHIFYLNDNHTSILGLRESFNSFQVITPQEFETELPFFGKPNGVKVLVAYPAMSNFSGRKYPLEWIEKIKKANSQSFVLLDAASYVGSYPLDLTTFSPDFVPISFYKIFGYPTGLGALLVKNTAFASLNRNGYFGGGTTEMIAVNSKDKVLKGNEIRFENGTLPFLQINALTHSLSWFESLGGMNVISKYTSQLTEICREALEELVYDNRQKLIFFYDINFSESRTILNFNILDRHGQIEGFSSFKKLCNLYEIKVRVGCFCNMAACQKYLKISDESILKYHKLGRICGEDQIDIVNGVPTGSIRISFGYYNDLSDIFKLIHVLNSHYTHQTISPTIKSPINNNNNGTTRKISSLYIYPIKSCGALSLTSSILTYQGLQFDRRWKILHGNKPLTQKSEPLLALISPFFDSKGFLTLSYPKSSNISIQDSSKVSEWLENILGYTNLRLVKAVESEDSFVNSSSLCILNRSSLLHLSSVSQVSDINWLIRQFRPNIVIDAPIPNEEESWSSIKIGAHIILSVDKLCKRCNIISIDQSSGEKVMEPLRALSKMKERAFCFGVLASLSYLENDDNSFLEINQMIQINVV